MKTALKIAYGALAFSSLSALADTASAQNAATGTGAGSVTVIAPITITAVNALAFGKVAQPGGAGGSITITPAGVVTRSNAAALAGGGTVQPASFNVQGDGAAVFAIAQAASSFNMTAGTSGTIVVTTSLSAATGTLSGATGTLGASTFSVGGILPLAAAQTPGVYAGSFLVTVTYN